MADDYQIARRAGGEDPVDPLGIGKATLADLCAQYQLFSHGPLHAWGGLGFDPVAEFVAASPDDPGIALVGLPEPVLVGATPPGWDGPPYDSLVMLCPHARWRPLQEFLLALTAVDRSAGRLVRAASRLVWLDDGLDLARRAVLPSPVPRVPVALFTPDGTAGRLEPVPRRDPRLPGPMHLAWQRPDAAIRGAAASLLAEDPDRPFAAIQAEHPLERLNRRAPR